MLLDFSAHCPLQTFRSAPSRRDGSPAARAPAMDPRDELEAAGASFLLLFLMIEDLGGVKPMNTHID